MKKFALITVMVFTGIVFASSALAESATKDECVTKCKEAAQLVKEKGMEAAFQELQNKDGKFVWKDTYVFVMDFAGTHLTHPLRPELVGKNVMGFKDSNGKLVVKEVFSADLDIALHDSHVALASLLGFVEVPFPRGWIVSLGRTEASFSALVRARRAASPEEPDSPETILGSVPRGW